MKCMLTEIENVQLPALLLSYDRLMLQLDLPDATQRAHDDLHRLAVKGLLDTMVSSVGALEVFSWHAGVCEARKLMMKRQLEHIAQTYPLLAGAVSQLERESVDS